MAHKMRGIFPSQAYVHAMLKSGQCHEVAMSDDRKTRVAVSRSLNSKVDATNPGSPTTGFRRWGGTNREQRPSMTFEMKH